MSTYLLLGIKCGSKYCHYVDVNNVKKYCRYMSHVIGLSPVCLLFPKMDQYYTTDQTAYTKLTRMEGGEIYRCNACLSAELKKFNKHDN